MPDPNGQFLNLSGNDPPELRHLDDATRSQLIGECNRRIEARLRVVERRVGIEVSILVPLCVWIGSTKWFEQLGAWGIAAIIVVFATYPFRLVSRNRQREREVLRLLMLERGLRPACCFQCGYDLRGSTSDTCPECGIPIEKQASPG